MTDTSPSPTPDTPDAAWAATAAETAGSSAAVGATESPANLTPDSAVPTAGGFEPVAAAGTPPRESLFPPEKPPWWRRHRRWLIAVPVVVALLAAAAVVYAVTRPGPEDVVVEYLEALRSADAETAREYASVVDEFDTITDALLTSKAMATDWRFGEPVLRYNGETEAATVDVRLTAADDTSRTGRFHLDEKGPNGSWRILNPLAKIELGAFPAAHADFNGEIAEPTEVEPDAASIVPFAARPRQVWLFPGAYRPYGSEPGLLDMGVETYVALPSTRNPADFPEEPVPAQAFVPLIDVTAELETEANRQLADFLDECATSKELAPEGCPFSGGIDRDDLRLNGEYYEAEEVSWEITGEPTVKLTQGAGTFTVVEVEPGSVTLSGTGRPYGESTAPIGKFRGECGIALKGAAARLAEPGRFEFFFGEYSANTCGSPYA